MDNQIMLITYADSLGNNLKELRRILSEQMDGVGGGVHILPFFPSSADRGFAPIRYDKVDEAFGDFSDIKELAAEHPLMFDFMVNHIPGFYRKKGRIRLSGFFHPLSGFLARRRADARPGGGYLQA